jgi:hypothetical protein
MNSNNVLIQTQLMGVFDQTPNAFKLFAGNNVYY